MNGDLIGREALLKEFKSHISAAENARDFRAADAWRGALEDVHDAPAVDAESVVHCCACKCFETDAGFCRYWESGTRCDDFCSRGAKMDKKEKAND